MDTRGETKWSGRARRASTRRAQAEARRTEARWAAAAVRAASGGAASGRAASGRAASGRAARADWITRDLVLAAAPTEVERRRQRLDFDDAHAANTYLLRCLFAEDNLVWLHCRYWARHGKNRRGPGWAPPASHTDDPERHAHYRSLVRVQIDRGVLPLLPDLLNLVLAYLHRGGKDS